MVGAGQASGGYGRGPSQGSSAQNNPLAPFPTELPLTVPTRPWVATVGLERTRVVEGMAEIIPKALQLKNHPLAPLHTELPLTGPTWPTWPLVARVGLEGARSV